ncbi:hypothetical protein J0X14_00395 [Muricauda sp. CAU 1633]|uniref:hypothetical protein n=1 Tax=Allomuricauda sp. CAU 1633 TaxID=2816036 RepID=UPI001A8F43CB|nr:hypothetical protein [Muricauda sp. CAU 1633]MBO0320737.1 hypothetical protein [Muricauda sp. CAU 1633]
MITILRNNKSLLRRKSLFRRESGFRRLRNEYRKYDEGRIESKPISQKELSEIREKIVKQNRRTNFRSSVLAIFLFALTIGFTIKLYNNLKRYQLEAEATIMKGKTEKYLFYIEDGDKWLEKGHFNNAIFQYLLAKEIYPSEYNVNYRLVIAYGGKCKYEQSGCTEGHRILKNLKAQFPEKSELYNLSNYFD